MSQFDLLADVLAGNLGMLQMTLADFSDADLYVRPVPNANNVAWQLGHLIASEAGMVNSCAGRSVIDLPAGFAERYTKATAASDDPAVLGSKAELLGLCASVRARTAAWVKSLTAEQMAKPAPEQMRKHFPTVGHVVHLFTSHTSMHVGQMQVLRRKLGKSLLF
ncbi:MAG: DinB family protein [Tepidisphaeraceae bacterium]|jgi:hypothetical protein